MTPATSTPAAATSALADAGFLTSFNLIVIAVAAMIVIIGILYGMRLRARRNSALQAADDRAREAGVAVPVETVPQPPTVAEAYSAPDAAEPVTILKGLGPKVAAILIDRGINTVGQLAALTDSQAAALDADLGAFTGRVSRDRWVEQARLLATGDRAGFEAAFGKL